MLTVQDKENYKEELIRARELNELLRAKCIRLESERNELIKRTISSQIDSAAINEKLLTIQHEREKFRKSNASLQNTLTAANEKIKELTTKFNGSQFSASSCEVELLTIQQQAENKNDLVKLIQNDLMKIRLNVAETDVLIVQLKKELQELEQNLNNLKNKKPDTVAIIQEEIIAANLREVKITEEFKNVKKQLMHLKVTVEEYVLTNQKTMQNVAWEDNTSTINFNFLTNKVSEDFQMELEQCLQRTLNLKEEIDELKAKMKKLEVKVAEKNKETYIKESIRNDLIICQEILYFKTLVTEKDIQKIQEDSKLLKSNFSNDRNNIKDSMNEKVTFIEESKRKINELESQENDARTGDTIQNKAIKLLEQNVEELEKKIEALKEPRSPLIY